MTHLNTIFQKTKLFLGAAAVLATVACGGTIRTTGDFTHEDPSLYVPLAEVDFEYVALGVSGFAEMEPIKADMYQTGKVGLVHTALSDLYDQVKEMKGGKYALINVTLDSSRSQDFRVTKNFFGNVISDILVSDQADLYVIRADVIKILSEPASATAPGMESDAPISGAYRFTTEDQDRLAGELAADLEAREG